MYNLAHRHSNKCVLLEYDGGHNSYYYSRSEEGSGDGCDPYSDDEDCYDYSEYEGSGSGADDYYSGGYDDETGDADATEENYPPWMTTTKPSVVKTRTEEDDIKLDEPRSTSTSLTTKTTSTAGASGVAPSPSLSAVRALLYFAVPLATCWLGNLFAVPSPSW